ncbi:MAG: DUF4956 domain-containing protein [Longimicrobiales bacterium]|nr:DUF4956 domain-containing protein [Longimicrobiales bacterium]
MNPRRVLSFVLKHPFSGVTVWFVLLGAALLALTFGSEGFRTLVMTSAGAPGSFPDLTAPARPLPPAGPTPEGTLLAAFVAVASLTGALLFSVPIIWIYTATRRQEGYETSFVRMMVGLPVVVAGVVRIVQGDLALAFALAGIVAAVRFRTTVKDLQNAVFAFAVIGIGLACGTGSFFVALALAVVFCAVAYLVWRLNVGKAEPGLRHAVGRATLADALVPGETHGAVTLGDAALVNRIAADDIPHFEEVADRLAHFVRADALRSKRKYDALLLLFTYVPGQVQDTVDPILAEHATRFIHVSSFPLVEAADGVPRPCVVLYLLRLQKQVDVWDMLERLECGRTADCIIRAAQVKPIKGLRAWIT